MFNYFLFSFWDMNGAFQSAILILCSEMIPGSAMGLIFLGQGGNELELTECQASV